MTFITTDDEVITMSNHLDSPLARQDTRLDITDVYLFRGTAGTVFVMNVNSSVAGRSYPELFHPVADIQCVTKWSKLDTHWQGVSIDTLLEPIDLDPSVIYVTAFCYGGYTTNLPLSEIVSGQAFVAYNYEGSPLPPEHGGPARLVVPHLYFWKSAKWVRGLRLMPEDKAGFWETFGYIRTERFGPTGGRS